MEELRNKPLVEALFEYKWKLEQLDVPTEAGEEKQIIDKQYKLLPGALFNNLRESYPNSEELPIAQIPDELTPYQVRHRFRASKNGWPVVQIGPGIVTINDTDGYEWKDFKKRALELVSALDKSYPGELPQIDALTLKYVDSVKIEAGTHSIEDFVKTKLKFSFELQPPLFNIAKVDPVALNFNFVAQFKPSELPGKLHFRIGTGTMGTSSDKSPRVFWQTTLISDSIDISEYKCEGEYMVENWLEKAHEVLHSWFFAQIEGELKERFI